MITNATQKNLLCATAIHRCVDILLNENTTEPQAQETKTALGVIFKGVMPFLRNEQRADHLFGVIDSVEKLHSTLPDSPSELFAKKASEYLGIDESLMFVITIPALCKTITQEIKNSETQEKSPLFERFEAVADVICRGESLSTVSKQLLFINQTLNIETPDFIGDEKCEKLNSIILSAEVTFPFDHIRTQEFVYSIFHKVRLSHLIEHYSQKNNAKSQDLLEQLIEEYGTENTDIFVDDPYYAKKKDRNVFVKGLQKYTLETLVLTKKFLDEYGLRFYLTEGTLLGAIRHNGFIPWDDDIDIAMPRQDYDRLVQLAKEGKIPPELNFDALENNPKHWVLGAKMQLTRKTPYIQHKVTRLSKCNGPYVDIFPLDYWSRPAGFKFSIANICVKVCRRLLFMKTGYSIATKKKPIRILARMILPFLKNTWIEKFAIKNMKKFYKGNRKYSVNLCSYYPYYKEVFPTAFFGEPIYVSFEGEQMPVPCEYDYILKTVYGKNYDTIPPVRVTTLRKHAFELNQEIQ